MQTFLSGSTPATCGIINNEWDDRATGKSVTSVEDHATKLVGVAGDRVGSSPHNLIVSIVGDEIKMAGYGASKTIGISMKDRASILPSVHMADASYWFDNKTEVVVTSTYYMQQLPPWVKKFNDEQWAQRSLGAKWFALGVDQNTAKPMMTLPSSPGPQFTSKWEETPWANDALEHFAEEAITNEQLGTHPGTDLLTVSFSANDHLGHDVGPDDPLVEDMSVRTDQVLGKLITAAERAAGGKQNLIVVFSADHGVAPKPETMQARKMPGGRLDKKAYLATVSKYLNDQFGEGDWILATGEGGSVYLNRDLIEQKKLKPEDFEDAVAAAARSMEPVERVYTAADLNKHFAPGSDNRRDGGPELLSRAQSGRHRGYAPYYLFGKEGSSHGSPYAYDSHVPLIFYGGNIKAGVYHGRTGVSDVAPTLAALLHIETPSGSVGHVLPQIMNPARQPAMAIAAR